MRNFLERSTLVLSAYLYSSELLAMADKCGDTANTACIAKPQGILTTLPKAGLTVQTLNWALMSVGVVLGATCIYRCSVKLNDEDYRGAIGPGVGAAVAMLSLFLVRQFI